MKIIWVMLVLIFSSSCHKSKDENLLNGEWKYVRSFKIYQSFHCYECPGFDYDSAIYHFLLKNNHEFTGRINLSLIHIFNLRVYILYINALIFIPAPTDAIMMTSPSFSC